MRIYTSCSKCRRTAFGTLFICLKVNYYLPLILESKAKPNEMFPTLSNSDKRWLVSCFSKRLARENAARN